MSKFYGNVEIRNNGKLKLLEGSSGSNFVSLRSPTSMSSDVEFVMPGADTASGALVSDGSGNLSLSLLANANISGSAAIAYSKLNLASSIVNADVASGAAIVESKLSLDFSTSSLNTAIGGKLSLSGGTMTGAINAGGFALSNLGAPTASSDAATKLYVDSAVNGLSWKQPVRVASTANVAIATGLENGDSIDGVTLATGNRVLLKNQTAPEENGIYVVVASGAASRSSDMDSLTPIDEVNGAAVWVLEGTANGDKAFAETAEVVTLGTDPLVFAQIGAGTAYTGGDGITISSNDISVDHDGQGLQFSSNQLALELDGTTLSKSASGLKVAALGITNSEVASAAAIAFSKMAALTTNRALTSNGSGVVTPSAVTDTELGYVSGVTSSIQTQLGTKANKSGDTFTGHVVLDNQREVRFVESGSTNYTALRSAASTAADTTYDLPAAYPASSGYLLASTTAGVMSWVAPPTVSSYKENWVTADTATKTVTHNLGTLDVIVQVHDVASGETIQIDSVTRTSTNAVDLVSNVAPPAGNWRVLVLAV